MGALTDCAGADTVSENTIEANFLVLQLKINAILTSLRVNGYIGGS